MSLFFCGSSKKLLTLIVGLGMICAGLVACTQGTTSTPPTNQGSILVGGTVSLTGDSSTDGKALLLGYQLWADNVNKNGGILGRQVKLDIKNDNSNPQQVTTDYQQLISVDKVNFLVSSFSGVLTIPAARVASRYNYAILEGAATEADTFNQKLPNLFSVSLSATSYLTTFDDYLLSLPQDQRPKTVAYATSDDPFTLPQIQAAQTTLQQGGLQTAAYATFSAETKDYTPIAQKIIASRADVVILGTTGAPDCLGLVQAFKQQHYNPKVLIATAGPDQGDQFTGPLGGTRAAEGIYVPNNGWFPRLKSFENAEFISSYIAKNGGTATDISADSVEAYSVGQVLQQAVNKIQSTDNAKLIQELRSDSFNTLQGPVKFNARGENILAIAYLFQWQKGQLTPVYPLSQALATPEFPKPNWP